MRTASLVILLSIIFSQPISAAPTQTSVEEGYIQLSNGRYKSAENIFRISIAKHPQDEQAQRYLAFILLKTDRVSEALKILTALTSEKHCQPFDLLLFGDGLRRVDKNHEALSVYQKCLQLQPQNEQAKFGVFESYKALHRKRMASELAAQALRTEQRPEVRAQWRQKLADLDEKETVQEGKLPDA